MPDSNRPNFTSTYVLALVLATTIPVACLVYKFIIMQQTGSTTTIPSHVVIELQERSLQVTNTGDAITNLYIELDIDYYDSLENRQIVSTKKVHINQLSNSSIYTVDLSEYVENAGDRIDSITVVGWYFRQVDSGKVRETISEIVRRSQ